MAQCSGMSPHAIPHASVLTFARPTRHSKERSQGVSVDDFVRSSLIAGLGITTGFFLGSIRNHDPRPLLIRKVLVALTFTVLVTGLSFLWSIAT